MVVYRQNEPLIYSFNHLFIYSLRTYLFLLWKGCEICLDFSKVTNKSDKHIPDERSIRQQGYKQAQRRCWKFETFDEYRNEAEI